MFKDNDFGLNFHHYFEEVFLKNCKGFNSCEIDPVLFQLDNVFSENCVDRVAQGLMHNEYIVVAGCQKVHIQVPMTKI
jgi:hypothetical protein